MTQPENGDYNHHTGVAASESLVFDFTTKYLPGQTTDLALGPQPSLTNATFHLTSFSTRPGRCLTRLTAACILCTHRDCPLELAANCSSHSKKSFLLPLPLMLMLMLMLLLMLMLMLMLMLLQF